MSWPPIGADTSRKTLQMPETIQNTPVCCVFAFCRRPLAALVFFLLHFAPILGSDVFLARRALRFAATRSLALAPRLSLQSPVLQQAAKSWRIVVGNQGVPLSEIRSASTLGPNFLAPRLCTFGFCGLLTVTAGPTWLLRSSI